jgi:hypothetical protein
MSKLVLIALLSVGALCAQNRVVSRTPDGHPDLQGVWTNATLTPVERPAALAGNNLFIGFSPWPARFMSMPATRETTR